MHIGEYLKAYWSDWVSLMSGAASVILTFWATLSQPSNANLRKSLWIVSALCFVLGSYRVWVRKHLEVERFKAEGEKEINQIVREFEEIKANILLTQLEPVIGAELKRLKTFIHKYPGFLKVNAVRKFYETFIASKEIHLHYGASLDFTQSEYREMKEQLSQISLSLNIE